MGICIVVLEIWKGQKKKIVMCKALVRKKLVVEVVEFPVTSANFENKNVFHLPILKTEWGYRGKGL